MEDRLRRRRLRLSAPTAAVKTRLNVLTFVILGAGLAGTWALVALGDPRPGDDLSAAALLYGWTALPYALSAATTHVLARAPARQLIVFAGAIGIALPGVGVLFDELVLRPKGTPSVTVLLLPAYQMIVAVSVLLVVAVLALRRRPTRAAG